MRKPNELTRILQVGMMLALPFGLASCAPDDGDEMETPETTLPDADVDMGRAAEPITIDIESVEDSEVEGEATISRVGESLMVSMSLEHLVGEGPFRAQILSGRCDDRMTTGTTGAPGTGMTDTTATDAVTPGAGTGMQGQVIATLEPVQLSGAAQPGAGQATAGAEQSGMSHSTIPVSEMSGVTEAYIEVQGQGARTLACGDVDNLSQLMMGGTGGASMSPSTTPGTNPQTAPGATPGTRP